MKKIIILFFVWLMTSSLVYANTHTITDYHAVFIPAFTDQGELRIAIRMFYKKKVAYYLVVNPYSFETASAPVTQFRSRKTLDPNVPGYFTLAEINHTPYMQALFKYTATPSVEQNAGLTHATESVDGYFLTIDLCPSVKPLEKDFFEMLVQKSEDEQSTIPITISVTGVWLLNHEREFKWLIKQEKQHKLNITWMNHSYSHVYYNDQDLSTDKNFLRSQFVNVDFELLEPEKILLENDELPSVFFRFPGLISSDDLILKLQSFGLIPVGSDAWLAKGQSPTPGSIVLVHGNSNEHNGIVIAIPLIQLSSFHLLPLSLSAKVGESLY